MKPIGDPGNATVGDVLRWSRTYAASVTPDERRRLWDMRSGMNGILRYMGCSEATRAADFLDAIPAAEERQRADHVRIVTLHARSARARGLVRQYLKHQPPTRQAPAVAPVEGTNQSQRAAPVLMEVARMVQLLPDFPMLAPRLAQLLADVLTKDGGAGETE